MKPIIEMAALGTQHLMNAFDDHTYHLNTVPTTSAGLVIGSSATTAVKIANTCAYKIGGIQYSKSTVEIAFTVGNASNVANGYETVFALTLDSSGNGLLVPGATSLGAATALLPEWPANGTACPIGYVRIYNNTGSVFTAGTTALSTSGLTVTYTNGYPAPLFSDAQ